MESYLLFHPFDNSQMYPFEAEPPGHTLWELGLDFTVSPGKTGFRSADAHDRAKGKKRFKIYGLALEGTTVAQSGDAVLVDGKQIGVATIYMYSSLTQQSMAIARLPLEYAVDGRAVAVRGGNHTTKALTHAFSFDDPEKKKRTAKG